MPDHIDVDVSELDFHHAIKVGDIKVAGIELVDPKQASVAVVEVPRAAKMAAEEAAAAAAAPAAEAAPAQVPQVRPLPQLQVMPRKPKLPRKTKAKNKIYQLQPVPIPRIFSGDFFYSV